MNTVAVSDLRNNISDYLNRVIYSGEDLYIKKGKSIVAKISKAKVESKKPSLLSLAGLLTPKEGDRIKKYIESLDTWNNDPI